MIKIAINGFGRIGRPTFRRILDNHPDIEVAAINDLTEKQTLAHLLKYDSVYGIYEKQFSSDIKFFAEKDPENLPWKDLGIDVVLECSGHFTDYEGASKHIKAGAKKVIISAPCKSKEVPGFVLGVNAEKYDAEKDHVVSMVSCTTNCLAPVAKVLHDNFGIKRGFMSTIHSYTNDQRILDLAHKDLRRARAAAINIIPTSTGAAKAIGKIIPEIEGKLDGISFRVPTATVSVVDLFCLLKKKTTAEKVNEAFKKASQQKELQGILAVEEAPLVSSDFKGNTHSAIVDSAMTMAIDDIVKVVAWYDNEWGYACRLADFTEFLANQL